MKHGLRGAIFILGIAFALTCAVAPGQALAQVEGVDSGDLAVAESYAEAQATADSQDSPANTQSATAASQVDAATKPASEAESAADDAAGAGQSSTTSTATGDEKGTEGSGDVASAGAAASSDAAANDPDDADGDAGDASEAGSATNANVSTSETEGDTSQENAQGDSQSGTQDGGDAAVSEGDASGASGDKEDEKAGETEASEEIEPYATPIADGEYVIATNLAEKAVLDCGSGNASDALNVQLYEYGASDSQIWKVTSDEYGLYTITNVSSGYVLDVQDGVTKAGKNVTTAAETDVLSQKWVIIEEDGYYRIQMALSTKHFLGVTGQKTANGTNVRIFSNVDIDGQLFVFYSTNPWVSVGNVTIKNGTYRISPTADSGVAIDVDSASLDDGANVQIYTKNGTQAQSFYIERTPKGYYHIVNVSSGLVVRVSSQSEALLPGSNVQQGLSDYDKAELWAIYLNDDGSYTFINKATGLALDLAGGYMDSGTNVQTYNSNGTNAQKFSLKSLSTVSAGTLTAHNLLNYKYVIDVPEASTEEGVQLQVYKSNETLAQKLIFEKVAKNQFTIMLGCSGKYLGVSDDGKVIQTADAQSTWQTGMARRGERYGITLTEVATGRTLEVTTGSVLVTEQRSTAMLRQLFLLKEVNLIADGLYTIKSAVGDNKVAQVSAYKAVKGSAVQLNTQDGYGWQSFYINYYKDGYYTITNAQTGLTLKTQVSGGGNGTLVTQSTYTGYKTQQWLPTVTENGWIVFKNRSTGLMLDVAGGMSDDGTSIQMYEANGTDAQKWKIEATEYVEYVPPYSDTVLRAFDVANSTYSSTDYLICIDLSAHHVVVFKESNGGWELERDMLCSNGASSTPTVEGTFSVGSRGYSFGSGYTCYYWTQFYGNYLFHSVLYYEDSWSIMDGRLGMYLSHGCIRLDIDDAYWIYSTIPYATRVMSYS